MDEAAVFIMHSMWLLALEDRDRYTFLYISANGRFLADVLASGTNGINGLICILAETEAKSPFFSGRDKKVNFSSV